MNTRNIRFILAFVSCIMIASALGCNTTDYATSADSGTAKKKMDKLNWSERNYKILSNLIDDYGIGGKYYSPAKPPYAVFDWDQTSAHLDSEEALLHYQLTNLRFKMSKEQFTALLKEDINGITKLSSEFKNITLKDINSDLIADYNYLYDNYSGLKGNLSLIEILQTPYYNDFISRLAYLYDGYCGTQGIGADYGYPWVIYLFSGFTIPEVKDVAKDAIKYELANKLSKQKWDSPVGFPTKSGPVSYSFKTGLRVFPEIQNLISTFNANGINVYIVSASFKPVIEVFSGIGNFGYNIPSDNVIAMETALSQDGKIIPEYKTGWAKTQSQGKVDAINIVIKGSLGKNWDPLFSAADSDGDYEMCTKFPDMKLSLIWNRLKGGDISKLCAQALQEKESPAPRYILQGRDENTGVAIPFSESILLGETIMRLLP